MILLVNEYQASNNCSKMQKCSLEHVDIFFIFMTMLKIPIRIIREILPETHFLKLDTGSRSPFNRL